MPKSVQLLFSDRFFPLNAHLEGAKIEDLRDLTRREKIENLYEKTKWA